MIHAHRGTRDAQVFSSDAHNEILAVQNLSRPPSRTRIMLAKYLRYGKPPHASNWHLTRSAQLAHPVDPHINRAQFCRTGIIDSDARTLHFAFCPSPKASPRSLRPDRASAVPWQTRGSRIGESLRALLSGPRAPRDFRGGRYFRDCWVKRHVPRRSIAFSIFWHAGILVLLIQFGSFLLSSPRATMVDNYDLSWSGPIRGFTAHRARRR